MTSIGKAVYLPETELTFGYAQRATHPKDGLLLFGPESNSLKGASLRVGVIGTLEGLDRYRRWVKQISDAVPPKLADNPNHTVFPGFEAVFGVRWPQDPIHFISVNPRDIHDCLYQSDRHQAIHQTVSLFAQPIADYVTRMSEVTIDLWFVVIPEEIFKLGRPQSKVSKNDALDASLTMDRKTAGRLRREPSLFLEDNDAAEVYKYELNFHNQLKARLLEHNVPLQVVRETTLAPADFLNAAGRPLRGLQDPATLSWNICTTAFFKAGGKPWKLSSPRPGVCYVGVVFKQDITGPEIGNACCGAQMFLDSGDGVVFRGAVGPWYSVENKQFHLSADKAKTMIEMVVNEYRRSHSGKPPSELFIHGKTYFDDAEWEGFRSAAPAGTAVTCVRIRKENGLKLFRLGVQNVPRGIGLKLSPKQGYLLSTGYTPRLQTYPGREVPNPLSVRITRGDADIETVFGDVMALTKLNFNACIFADGQPVTLRFANAVGEILTAGPQKPDLPPLPFRYYI